MRRTSFLLTALIVASLSTVAERAQAQSHDRKIDAIVLDAQGLPVLGAQVTATQPQGNLRRTATSATE